MIQDDQPDPRRKRAFILGAALLGAIVLWQGPWWGDDDDDRVVISTDAESGEEIRARVREEIRESIRDATGDAEEAADEAAEAVNEAAAEAREAGEDPVVRVEENEDGRGVTINVNPADGNDDGR